jgi:hypothetical protein
MLWRSSGSKYFYSDISLYRALIEIFEIFDRRLIPITGRTIWKHLVLILAGVEVKKCEISVGQNILIIKLCSHLKGVK